MKRVRKKGRKRKGDRERDREMKRVREKGRKRKKIEKGKE